MNRPGGARRFHVQAARAVRRRAGLAAAALALLVVGFAAGGGVVAGELSRADLERRFPPPLRVAEKLREVPAWPLTSELEPEAGPVGYVFESIDLAAIPGFEGTPFNLLVAIDRHGRFLDVEVLRQHEPVFLSGLGPQPLHDFVRQYAGLDLKQGITVGSGYGARGTAAPRGGGPVVLDGVAKATASVRIVNQTVLASALAVARARLGFADRSGKHSSRAPPAQPIETDVAGERPLTVAELLGGGYVALVRMTNRELDALFAGSELADADEAARRDPEGVYAELYVAYLGAPRIGRALFGETAYRRLMATRHHGQHLYWIASAGRHELLDEGFVPGTAPARLRLAQDGLPLELRDFGADDQKPVLFPGLRYGRVFQVEAHAGLDPARPVELTATAVRRQGMILPRSEERAMTLRYQPPAALFFFPPAPLPEWLIAWKARGVELAALALGLAGLFVALARPALIGRHLAAVRRAWLVFVLVFVGWHAQGQLSIVQVTGAVKTLAAGHDLSSFLYDPVSLLLIAVLPVSFVLWGRGVFCGWLCPFGALQEFVGDAARRLRVRQRRLPPRLATVLDRGRFVLLGALVVAAAAAPALAERLVEVEPFKTAITVGFDRAWPYVAYALAVLAAGAVVYKFFCRFLCPLGAFMELGGLLRARRWLARRPECGKPCQVCRRACRYDAIERSGAIDYRRCHQCLDCVVIHDDPQRCVPLIRQARVLRKSATLNPPANP